jgi:hypothetical protein
MPLIKPVSLADRAQGGFVRTARKPPVLVYELFFRGVAANSVKLCNAFTEPCSGWTADRLNKVLAANGLAEA